MVQGGRKISNVRPGEVKKAGRSGQAAKQQKKAKMAKIGNPVKIPKKMDDNAETDRLLSIAIDKSNEKKMSAKALQSGVRVGTKDLLEGGKELNRDARRKQLKNKVTRVEEKLQALEKKAQDEGLL